MQNSRWRIVYSLVGVLGITFFALGLAAPRNTTAKERIFFGRPCLVTSDEELRADTGLHEVQETIVNWVRTQTYGSWEPGDLVRFLRSKYALVELDPSLPMHYEYVLDETGVVVRICIKDETVNLVRGLGEGRVQIHLQRWMEMN